MHDVRAYFDALAPTWDTEHPAPPAIETTAFLSGAAPGLRLLDIACGTGVMTAALLARGAIVTGIDLSPAMIEIAKRKHGAAAEFHAGDVLDFTGGPFEAALLFNAWPHFPRPRALAEKVASLLVPGGRFTIAHGTGRAGINAIHKGVPAGLSSALGPAKEEAKALEGLFELDSIIDRPDFYLFSGIKQ